MNYLITAAGKGERFLKEGIKPPKPLIKVLGTELIFWSLKSFEFKPSDNLFIVTQKNDRVREKISKKLELIYSFINIYWLELDSHKNGQLITAIECVKKFNIKGKILIHNCDTLYKCKNNAFENNNKNKLFGSIVYFNSEGNNWSFIRIENNKIIEVKEKERISDNCSVGTYYFCDAQLFLEISEKYFLSFDRNHLEEFYIAPLYDFAIKNSFEVLPIKCNSVKVFGTCDELLKSFQISLSELQSENDYSGHQRKTLVLDIDGTICSGPINGDYSLCKPKEKVCEKIRFENSIGSYIILYTSRNVRSYRGNMGLINKYTARVLSDWLTKNRIPYDELYFGKPWGHGHLSYVDDKLLSIKEFLNE